MDRKDITRNLDAPLSTNDNATAEPGTIPPDADPEYIINKAREGMTVVDANSETIGKVDYVSMGDPEAATVDHSMDFDTGLVGNVARALGAEDEPDVPEPLRSRLKLYGYIKVDGKGWIDTDRYVTADQIAAISGDTVQLSVTKEQVTSDKG